MYNMHLTIKISCNKILVRLKFVVVEDFLISYHHCCFLEETVCVYVCVCMCVHVCDYYNCMTDTTTESL